jgi:hypothetical protein
VEEPRVNTQQAFVGPKILQEMRHSRSQRVYQVPTEQGFDPKQEAEQQRQVAPKEYRHHMSMAGHYSGVHGVKSAKQGEKSRL